MKKSSGFTLIELIVSIAVIGILASLTVAIYQEYRVRAQVAVVMQDIRNIETAIRAYSDLIESSTWPWETSMPGGGEDPSIVPMSAVTTGLGRFLPKAPVPPFSDGYYGYDNDSYDPDGFNTTTCSGASDGVGILMIASNIPDLFFTILNNNLDTDSSLTCGKVRRSAAGNLYYMIARSYRDF